MHCTACVSHIEKAMAKLPGVTNVSISLVPPQMFLTYDKQQLNIDQIIQAVSDAGYTATPKDKTITTTSTNSKDNDNDLSSLSASILLLLPLMYLAMGHMLSLPMPQFLITPLLILTELLLALPIIYLNRRYYQQGFRALCIQKAANMDSLVAVSSTAALVYGIITLYQSIYNVSMGITASVPDIYIETAAMIVVMVSIGKYLERRSQHVATAALTGLIQLIPKTAWVMRDGQAIEVTTESIMAGDLIMLKPGQYVPVDGIVTEGNAIMDESSLTGESLPVTKTVGMSVTAGTINQQGSVIFRATNVGKDTVLAQIITLVETAAASKAPIAKLADRISAIFVPAVLVISLLTLGIWLLSGASFAFALARAIAVLVVSCPCALGLATPIAILVGSSKSASLGILVKDATAFETLAKINTIVFDKTGTLTQGKLQLTNVHPYSNLSTSELLQLAASMENASTHPIAQAINTAALEQQLSLIKVTDFLNLDGEGIQAKLNGNRYFIGSEQAIAKRGIHITNDNATQDIIIYIAKDQELLGSIGFADQLKPEAIATVAQLRQEHLYTVMLTGDRQVTAAAIQAQLHLDQIYAELLPAHKERSIHELQNAGKTIAMVGDGINDAPALVRADVGIAIGRGTDIAVDAANVVLIQDDLTKVVTAIHLGKSVLHNIKENFAWAFSYNIIGIPLAAGVFYPWFGWTLNPMFAAAAMSISSVLVVLNALRLNRFHEKTVMTHPTIKKLLKLQGLNCEHCVAKVTTALNAITGVQATVNLARQEATVSLDNPSITDAQLQQTISDCGYTVIKMQDLA